MQKASLENETFESLTTIASSERIGELGNIGEIVWQIQNSTTPLVYNRVTWICDVCDIVGKA
jgi:hypothetical protein